MNEIDGYLELGMEGEAIEAVGQTLSKSEITADEFHSCVFALLQSEHPESSKALVEKAYLRLPRPVNDQVRSAMLNFYFTLGESETAFAFFPRRSTKFFDAWTMMHVCLDLGRVDEAKKVARYCRGLLASTDNDFTKASMADALASYHLRISDPESAIRLWEEAPLEPAFQRQRLTGMVKARLLQALQEANLGLTELTRTQEDAAPGMELQLSGTTVAILADTERDLRNLQTKIEQVIPEFKGTGEV